MCLYFNFSCITCICNTYSCSVTVVTRGLVSFLINTSELSVYNLHTVDDDDSYFVDGHGVGSIGGGGVCGYGGAGHAGLVLVVLVVHLCLSGSLVSPAWHRSTFPDPYLPVKYATTALHHPNFQCTSVIVALH